MTQQDDITQRVRDNATQILDAIRSAGYRDHPTNIERKRVDAILSAVEPLLSKLRAPVADERAAFEAWVKAQHPDAPSMLWRADDTYAYSASEWKAWQARAALASAPVASARAALAQLEAACDTLCRLRTQEQYLSMVDSGQQDALLALDDARAQARAALASAPVAEPDTMGEIHRQERERSPWVLPKDPTLPDSAPVAGEAVTMKEICPDCGHQFQCFHNPYINQLRAAPQASEAVRNAALEEAAKLMDQTLRSNGAALIRDLKRSQADKDGARCTCPSGDGSLRHPCPMHPGADKDGGQQRAGDGKTREAVDYVRGGALNFDDPAPNIDLEAAAKTLAECMDYPWAHMPEKGREQMRLHAQSVIRAALSATQAGQGDTREA
ncbi:hypothetical protein [Achromobacter xylosoxidans]|uniref:hypothetical protein n=1 Tax=Alcaligenes xylosoxydans xylosoxydans TaxID=85698 RepID=UPI0006C6E774|nr:hypothetical protein [Achromobacter xylosoxidans]CUI30353.1 Uncharacterised protein [Achromobacter xylosoxidans]